MDTHKNAPLTPKGREAMVRSVIEGGLTKVAARGFDEVRRGQKCFAHNPRKLWHSAARWPSRSPI